MKIKLEERLKKKDLTIYDLKDIIVNFDEDAMMEVLKSLKDVDNNELKDFYVDLFHLGMEYEQKEIIKKGAF